MDRDEAMQIIKNEQLTNYHYNMFEDRYNHEDEVVIKKREGKWVVYTTDERAAMFTGSDLEYNTESEALDHFIKRLRAKKRYEELCDLMRQEDESKSKTSK